MCEVGGMRDAPPVPPLSVLVLITVLLDAHAEGGAWYGRTVAHALVLSANEVALGVLEVDLARRRAVAALPATPNVAKPSQAASPAEARR